MARVHPGEIVSSFIVKGVCSEIFGSSHEAAYFNSNFIIKIVPMINPDGVLHGNTRTSAAGCDLNRRWKNPKNVLHP